MSEIFEDIKDMGILIGKGGIYGQVTALTFSLASLFAKSACGINPAGKLLVLLRTVRFSRCIITDP